MADAMPAGMKAALRAARRGEGRVSPNPVVGAAVEIPGRGITAAHHARFGGPHAEARLLDRVAPAAPLAPGSTLFVTLEPCTHEGKTPPCAERVIAARPARVVVACVDPDPRVSGRGIERIRAAGIEVVVGPGVAEALGDNLAFHVHNRLGRALIRLKLATSLDARLGSRAGRATRITGDSSIREVHRERAVADAILVGSGTMEADDPLLTVRAVRGPDPSRIVVDSGLRTAPRCRTWKAWAEETDRTPGLSVAAELAGNYRRVTGRAGPRWVRRPRLILATRAGHAPRRLDSYRRLGWEIWELPIARSAPAGHGHVSLRALAARAGKEGFLRLLVEAGPRLAGALLSGRLVDELSLYVAPMVLGGDLVWPAGWAARGITRAIRFEPVTEIALGDDRHVLLRRCGLLEEVAWKGGPMAAP